MSYGHIKYLVHRMCITWYIPVLVLVTIIFRYFYIYIPLCILGIRVYMSYRPCHQQWWLILVQNASWGLFPCTRYRGTLVYIIPCTWYAYCWRLRYVERAYTAVNTFLVGSSCLFLTLFFRADSEYLVCASSDQFDQYQVSIVINNTNCTLHQVSTLTLVGLQSRFGGKLLRISVVCSPKRDCGSKRVNLYQQTAAATYI